MSALIDTRFFPAPSAIFHTFIDLARSGEPWTNLWASQSRKVLIAISEMTGADSGLGYMIWNSWQILSVETMHVGLILIAILGALLTLALDEAERWLLPWKN